MMSSSNFKKHYKIHNSQYPNAPIAPSLRMSTKKQSSCTEEILIQTQKKTPTDYEIMI